MTTTPFHEGEQAVQERMGVREQIEPWARQVVRTQLPDQHREFYASLPFLVVAARDDQGRAWATMLAGQKGFISTPDATSLNIGARLAPGDALDNSLTAGADIGLLGIEFATRRRNRVNGRVIANGEDGLRVAVDQSFGNCPQYIHEREWMSAEADTTPLVRRTNYLTPALSDWIAQADTFFIASGHRGEGEARYFGMDASHRGGDPGFVRVRDDRTLIWPDYAGNNHYNTIGNLVVNPGVGMLFVDFEGGHLLQITGKASIDWDSPEVAAFPGARRIVTVTVEEVIELRNAVPIHWTGAATAIRSLRLVNKHPETDDVTSFIFESRDGGELPDFEPGQHLPIEVPIDGFERRVSRTYSLSAASNGATYRLSIKREPQGLVSRLLHDQLSEGDMLSASTPAGDFVLRPGARPVVLVSAGIGVTPMMSMLEALAAENGLREVWFVHGARDGAHHALAQDARRIIDDNPNMHSSVSYSRPRTQDALGRDYHREGRVDGQLLETLLPTLDSDYYLCGPVNFLAQLQQDLIDLGVRREHIFTESFGGQG